MNNCNGRASFSTNYDPTPMRQPGAKSKDSVLSAEAPEFVPSFQKAPAVPEMSANLGPPIPQQFIQQPPFPQQQPHPHHQSHPQHHHNHHHQPQLNHLQHMNHNQNHHHHQHHHSHHHNMNHQNHGGPNQRQNNSNYSVQNRLSQFNGSVSGGRQQQPPHYHQQQPHMPRGAPNGGAPNINQAQQQMQQLQISRFDGNEGDNNEPTEAEMHALSFLIEVMEKLNSDPGKYESYQKELTTLYIEFAENQHVISNAIELIFTQSIDEQNFRYTGARLCRLLDSIDPSPDSVFRGLLCRKLQYNDGEIIQYMTNETHKVRNTTLFLAELYIQLQNDGSRITSIANSIHNAISLLMPKLSPENIKCVCQTLKLCGYELDIDFPKETEELMCQLGNCDNTDVSTQRLLTAVIELRKNRWGRSEPNALATPAPSTEPTSQEFNNDPVFYGPDGEILTDEESAFLWNATSSYPSEGFEEEEDNDPDALVEIEPEMDLEIQLAFKDFVTYQNNK